AAGAAAALAPGGWFLLEHHFDQSDAVAALLAAAGLVQLDRHHDLEGQWRFASARAPQSGDSAPLDA
ncbi:MAG: protein-(glutamine-N5) methyltransferase, release factor-specific, partial [Cyanobacteriota bacterium]|nr:protein-(glutamine-N5) methyltransferase, release factor-specific [Cyanobacteriota bacterium]